MTSPSAPSEQPPDGQQVRVPAPVLVDAERDARRLGGVDRGARLRRVERERLVHHDREAELDRLQRERDVGCRGRGDGDGVRARRRQGREAVEGRRAGMVALELGAPLRRTGHDPGELDTGGRGQQRSVEDAPAEAVAREPDPRRGGHLADPATLRARSLTR